MGKRRNYPNKSDSDESSNAKSRTTNSKGGKRGRKPRKSEGESYQKTEATNDVGWRINNIKLRTDAGNISWSYQTGDTIPIKSAGNLGDPSANIVLPGVMNRFEALDPGAFGTLPGTPANVAANSLLTVMRSKTRVRNTYDAPDVMNIVLAAAEIYAGIAFAKRLYGTNLMYSYMNKYLPDALFKAQRIDPTPLKQDAYGFVSRLNRLICMMNTIYIPDRMPLFRVVTQRYGNYYIEGPSIKDQIYCATPGILRIYTNLATTDYAGALLPAFISPHGTGFNAGVPSSVKYGTVDSTTDELLTALERMILALINDSDVPDITGDMQNAFGEGGRYIIPLLSADELIAPVYDEEFLETFLNSKTHLWVFNWFNSYDYATQITKTTLNERNLGFIIQDPNTNSIGMVSGFHVSTTAPTRAWGCTDSNLLSVHKEPSVDKTIMITRYCDQVIGNSYVSGGQTHYSLAVHASAIIGLKYNMVYFDATGTLQISDFSTEIDSTSLAGLQLLINMEPFHYRPTLYVGTLVNNVPTLQTISGSLDIVSTIDQRDKIEIDRLDMLNLLGAFDNV